jgi:hypothetical protein
LAGEAIICGGLAFNTFESSRNLWLRNFITALRPSYIPPARKYIAEYLLPIIYADVKEQVDAILHQQEVLNFCTDESSTRSDDRVANCSVNVPGFGSFHVHTESLKDKDANAKQLTIITTEKLREVVTNRVTGEVDWNRINSLYNNTCNTIRAQQRNLKADPNLAHVFYILCDSHGLQLLFTDILKRSPHWSKVMGEVNAVATFFHKAKRALAILRTHMDRIGKRTSFVLSCLTRWGSQYGVVKGVLAADEALRLFARDVRVNAMLQRGSKKADDEDTNKLLRRVIQLLRNPNF